MSGSLAILHLKMIQKIYSKVGSNPFYAYEIGFDARERGNIKELRNKDLIRRASARREPATRWVLTPTAIKYIQGKGKLHSREATPSQL